MWTRADTSSLECLPLDMQHVIEAYVPDDARMALAFTCRERYARMWTKPRDEFFVAFRAGRVDVARWINEVMGICNHPKICLRRIYLGGDVCKLTLLASMSAVMHAHVYSPAFLLDAMIEYDREYDYLSHKEKYEGCDVSKYVSHGIMDHLLVEGVTVHLPLLIEKCKPLNCWVFARIVRRFKLPLEPQHVLHWYAANERGDKSWIGDDSDPVLGDLLRSLDKKKDAKELYKIAAEGNYKRFFKTLKEKGFPYRETMRDDSMSTEARERFNKWVR